jgi:hypothetical protein
LGMTKEFHGFLALSDAATKIDRFGNEKNWSSGSILLSNY